MTLYKCSYCDYSTDNEYRWNKHILSKKHISKKNKSSNNDFEDIDNILNVISNSSCNKNSVQEFLDIDEDTVIDIEDNSIDIEDNSIDIEDNLVDIEDNSIDIEDNIIYDKENIEIEFNKHSNFTEINKDNILGNIDEVNLSSQEKNDNLENDINESDIKIKEELNDKINILNKELECYKRKYNTAIEELNKLKNKFPEPEPNFQNFTDFTFNSDENKPIFITDSNIDDSNINRIRQSINKLKEIGKYKYYKLDDINLISNKINQEITNNIENELNIIEIDAQKSYDLFDPFLSINDSDNDN